MFSGNGKAVSVAIYQSSACAVLDTKDVVCWGAGEYIGKGDSPPAENPDVLSAYTPLTFPVGFDAVKVGVGARHACALSDVGDVICWGDGEYGSSSSQISVLGYGNDADVRGPLGNQPPIALPAGRTAKELQLGDRHTCVILDNDQALCWGIGGQGRLGHGSHGNIGDGSGPDVADASPLNMPNDAPVKLISAGSTFTCTVLTDAGVDHVLCFGLGSLGQLGHGSTAGQGHTGSISTFTPIPLPANADALSLSCGVFHCALVTAANEVLTWGRNHVGQLGDTTTDNYGDTAGETITARSPVLSNVREVSCGGEQTCVITLSDTVMCWGGNSAGSVGVGGSTNVQILTAAQGYVFPNAGAADASCGNGVIDLESETCDDANVDDTDDCLSTCVTASCGDGFIQAGVETCEDGNEINDDGCTGCVLDCGNGSIESAVEQCEDGNEIDGDGCTACVIDDGFACVPGSLPSDCRPFCEIAHRVANDVTFADLVLSNGIRLEGMDTTQPCGNAGDLAYNSGDLYMCDGSSWVALASTAL